MVFSDESWFYLEENRIRFVRRYEGETLSEDYINTFQKAKNPRKIMVWAAICYNGRRILEFIDGSMDSNCYLKILEKNLPRLKELWNRHEIF